VYQYIKKKKEKGLQRNPKLQQSFLVWYYKESGGVRPEEVMLRYCKETVALLVEKMWHGGTASDAHNARR
jgi:hypothetical protein